MGGWQDRRPAERRVWMACVVSLDLSVNIDEVDVQSGSCVTNLPGIGLFVGRGARNQGIDTHSWTCIYDACNVVDGHGQVVGHRDPSVRGYGANLSELHVQQATVGRALRNV